MTEEAAGPAPYHRRQRLDGESEDFSTKELENRLTRVETKIESNRWMLGVIVLPVILAVIGATVAIVVALANAG